jgi:ribose transport system ATP-binding protein
VRELSKAFGGAQALSGVSLEVAPGEVHGLLGENGSGKSTLIKILAGYHAPDAGRVEVRGSPVKLPLAPGQFRKLGMEFVHQDLGLILSLSVLENLRIGELATSRDRLRIAWGRERRRARETFARYDLDLDPEARVADLQPVERALLAVVRAVEGMKQGPVEAAAPPGLLFLDEPTAFLPKDQVERLFALIREITRTGASVVFVSHDLQEVFQLTDRVTVLRNGRNVATVETGQTSQEALVRMIIGQDLSAFQVSSHRVPAGPALLQLQEVAGERLRSTSFEVHGGEVVGLTGLLGAGYEELPYVLFGASPSRRGTLVIGSERFELSEMTPTRAIAAGIGLIPADRQGDGSVGSLSVTDNLTVSVLTSYFRRLLLGRRRMRQRTAALMRQFDVRPPEPAITYSALSGGNQQKALLAKWLQTRPRLLLLHEPTQGVDVGARQRILALIREAVEAGTVVICASSDYEQLALLCDRVLVFARGRLTRELTGADLTRERITEQCLTSAQA